MHRVVTTGRNKETGQLVAIKKQNQQDQDKYGVWVFYASLW